MIDIIVNPVANGKKALKCAAAAEKRLKERGAEYRIHYTNAPKHATEIARELSKTSDTIVALGGEILGKPENREEAEEMLRRLSGKTHRVTTGYALFAENFSETGSVMTEVEFEDLPEQTIKAYLDSGLWQGKAGAYGIQDGFPLVKSFSGDRDNVVGLPISAIKSTLDLLLK